jgi:lipopolysaccharide transport system ATP-binding protein
MYIKEYNIKSEDLLTVENVSKKFCKELRHSMLYGFLDIINLNGRSDKLRLRKHEFLALKDINFTLKKGERLGILGKNGAGKTTLMRLITNTFPSTTGIVKVNGNVTTIYEKNRSFSKYYSAIENIKIKSALFGMNKKQINDKMDEILDFAEVRDFATAPFGTFSSGMRARVNVAVALVANPDLLIIDEGLAVSDVVFRRKCYNKLTEISDSCGIIIISHNIEQIQELANRIMLIEHGKVVYDGTDIQETINRYSI